MAYYLQQADFSRGEISPLLGSRANVDFWQQSLFECTNFQILTHGGMRRRSGTQFVAELKSSAETARLFPFIFSEQQSYMLVMNAGAVRFLAQRGVIGAPYEIASPYPESALERLSYTQFNDVAYIARRGYSPRKLQRNADANWNLATAIFENGPYLDAPLNVATTFTPAATGEPTGYTEDSSTAVTGGYYEISFAAGVFKTVDAYWITATDNSNVGDSPSGWELQGWTGSDWVVLDVIEGETGWQRSSRHYYTINNKIAFNKYRLNWRGPQRDEAGQLRWGQIRFHQLASEQTPFLLTASSVAGINNGAGFQSSDAGRSIRLRSANAGWQWAQIVSVLNTTQVNIRLHGQALISLAPLPNWQLGAFSASSGFPAAVTLFNERVFWASTDSKPTTVYGSKQGNFEDYGFSDPIEVTDGLSLTLLSSNMNDVLWLADDVDLIAGSAGQIRSIGPADTTQSFSATNFDQKKGPTSGADTLQPLSIGGVTLYVGIGGTKIRELVLGDQNRYVAPELSLLGEHFFKSGIVDWAFAERPLPTIYAATANGDLIAVTYDREQRVVGFARHKIAGGSVENVSVLPGTLVGYDDVYLVVRRIINGQVKRYIEVLERPFDGDIDQVSDAFNVDCGLRYNGPAIQTVTGLNHLEGQTVIALCDGNVVEGITNDQGETTPLVVSGGAISLPYPASKISVGLRFKSRAVTLPIAGPQQDGSIFGRKKNVFGVVLDVLNSGAAKVGNLGTKDWQPEIREQMFNEGDEIIGNEVNLQTGFVQCQTEGSWCEGEGQIVIETDEPLPLLVRSLILQLENEP